MPTNLVGSRSPKDVLEKNAELHKIREEQCEMIRKLEEQAADVARFGDDRPSSAWARYANFRSSGNTVGLDTVEAAERIIAFPDNHSPDAVVVDGDGLAADVADQLGSWIQQRPF